MTTSSNTQPVLPSTGASQRETAVGSALKSQGQPRMFKKHKVLPHPRKEGYPPLASHDLQRSTPRKFRMEGDAILSQSPRDPPRSKPPAGGPQPPPTPPAHSRKSSSSRSANPSSPTYIATTPLQSTENVRAQAPTTPTNQQTPPTPNLTPDRTPPGQAARPVQLARPAEIRPSINNRLVSRLTSDSRTESFRTAPENPCSSDDDDGKSTLRPLPPSAKTSQSTVRPIKTDKKPSPKTIGLGLGLESTVGDDLTPRTAKAFSTFDGEWVDKAGGSGSEVEVEWDDNLGRNVTVKKRRPAVNGKTKEVVEDLTVTPTNATRALRSMSLQESPIVYPSRRVVSDRFPMTRPPPSHSESSISIDLKRSSMMSTRSTASTIVEAILVETAPQRRKTLRHVRKQMTLRDSRSDLSPTSSAPTSVSAYVEAAPQRSLSKPQVMPRESYASTATANSISSRKARREVIKSGAIPVVVVPQRRSSNKSSKEPSLRSTSSRRSKRTQSLSSVPVSQASQSREYVLHADKLPRRSRTLSESDGSRPGDQRTIDFPPAIPTRSSSLSAPTSRNVSRTGSLTAESLKAHNAFQESQQALQGARRALERIHSERTRARATGNVPKEQVESETPKTPKTPQAAQAEQLRPEIMIRRATSIESETSRGNRHSHATNESHDIHTHHRERLHVDRYGDPFFGKRLSVQNTPFSQISVTTTGTSHAEVSEAMAVNLYPHQNKSVVLVDHSSSKPSASSSLEQQKTPETEVPQIRATDANGVPMTPPQVFTMDDIDSPLRNPRAAPPAPPAINFIPATPSGLTPGVEKDKMLGNFYEITGTSDDKPKKRPSLLQRTLSRGRQSYYGPAPTRPTGLLARTLSLTRGASFRSASSHGSNRRHSYADDGPADENRLHPHWRPAYDDYSSSSGSDWDSDEEDDGPRTYRFPRIDNRPGGGGGGRPRRSLSARFKETLSLRPGTSSGSSTREHYSNTHNPLDRRTIRRTPSGNLRVMKFRKSLESMPRLDRAYTADGAAGESGLARQLRFWRTPRASWVALGERMNLPRRMSERRRERRSQELRRMISGPREVRDGVGDVLRRG